MSPSLSRSQAIRMVLYGLVVWFVGALAVRLVRQFDLLDAQMALVYLATFPMMFITVWLGRRIGGLSDAQYVTGVAVATASAIACDGLAIPLLPALYGGPGEDFARGAAWILFAGAVGFIPPLWALRRSPA